ncbi:MAG: hypothetical protein PVH84_18650 [Candidatus Aminicenantes bacterium]
MITALRYGVIFSFVLSSAILIYLLIKTRTFGRKRLLSAPRGSWKKGILYAFGKGMMPWEKESAQKHLWTYLAGFGYHFGIFAAFGYLLFKIFMWPIGSFPLNVLKIFMVCGLACGVALGIKRSLVKTMRKLSCPDDYVANVFVDLFVLLAFLDSFLPGIRPIFYAQSIILVIYMPVGKIRHCFFFFYSRILFGYFFGRRGVFQQKQKPLELKQ